MLAAASFGPFAILDEASFVPTPERLPSRTRHLIHAPALGKDPTTAYQDMSLVIPALPRGLHWPCHWPPLPPFAALLPTALPHV